MKVQNTPTLPDFISNLHTRIIKKPFFAQINSTLEGRKISKDINKHYKQGKTAVGCLSYDNLFLFKIDLLHDWYARNDYKIDDRANNNISFSHFYGLNARQVAPDAKALSSFKIVVKKDILVTLLRMKWKTNFDVIRKKHLEKAELATKTSTNETSNMEEILDEADIPIKNSLNGDKGHILKKLRSKKDDKSPNLK